LNDNLPRRRNFQVSSSLRPRRPHIYCSSSSFLSIPQGCHGRLTLLYCCLMHQQLASCLNNSSVFEYLFLIFNSISMLFQIIRTRGASNIVKSENSGEDPRATGGLVSNLFHPRVNKTKQDTQQQVDGRG